MIDGVVISMGGKKWLVPPLNLKFLRKNSERLAQYQGVSAASPDSVDMALEIIQAALSRNYPEITSDVLLEIVDMGNVQQIMEAIMGISGLERVSGEAWKGSVESQPTGEISTASL
jgi:hypothetical protein